VRPFQTILCATDLSTDGDEALRHADALARLYHARLVVFHALPDLARSSPLFPHLAQRDNGAFVGLERRVLEALRASAQTITGRTDADVVFELGFGSADTAIVEHATQRGADLVVVGGAGPKGAARAVLGAVAERVVRHAHCPVWVARAGPTEGPVVIGTDFSDPAVPALERGVDHARRLGARLTAVHAISMPTLQVPGDSPEAPAFPVWSEDEINDVRARASAKLGEALARFGMEKAGVVDDGAPVEAILSVAEKHSARLICVGTLGRTGVRRLLLGSVAEAVVRKAHCSVLVERLHPG
jgi:nucleotide-binding universal stress UspA family protein